MAAHNGTDGKLMEMLTGYAASHQHPFNVFVHMIGIPTIMLGVLIPLTWVTIEVNGKPFVAQAPVPMPPFAGLSDKEIAELLTYLRSQFGNKAEPISAEQVAEVRERTKDRAIPWTTDEFKVNQ